MICPYCQRQIPSDSLVCGYCGHKIEETLQKAEAPAEAAGDYKIGIMTTTVSQSEESYRAAEMLQEQHPDTVVLQHSLINLQLSRRPLFPQP